MSESNILRVEDLSDEVLNAEGGVDAVKSARSEPVQAYESGEAFKDIVKRQTQAVERAIIENALAENDGNVTKTAERLGLSRKGLQLKLKELGIVSR